MRKILPFIHAVKLYWKAIKYMDLTQYRRTHLEEKEKILERNKKMEQFVL